MDNQGSPDTLGKLLAQKSRIKMNRNNNSGNERIIRMKDSNK